MHYTKIITRLLGFISIVFLPLFLTGCPVSKDNSSTDMQKLSDQVDVNIIASSGKWEVFETPEYTGGLPAPTDFVTLIAELEGIPQGWTLGKTPSIDNVWIAPEAERKWLSPGWRTFIRRAKFNILQLTPKDNCYLHTGSMRKSGRKVEGFVCERSGRALLYLTLRQP